MRHTAWVAVCVILMIAALTSLAMGAGAVTPPKPYPNMATFNPPRPQPLTTATADAVANWVQPGWTVTDMLGCELNGGAPRELAVVVCRTDASQPAASWWLRYSGPLMLLVFNEADITAGPIAEFEFDGYAPPADPALNLVYPLFVADLDADGAWELFIRSRQYTPGANSWTLFGMVKYHNGALRKAGIFGVKSHGGLYFVDNLKANRGLEVALINFVGDDYEETFTPHPYRAQTFGWANGYYPLIADHVTTTKYTSPDDAFRNILKWIWNIRGADPGFSHLPYPHPREN